MKRILFLIFTIAAGFSLSKADSQASTTIHREAWSFDQSLLEWDNGDSNAAPQKQAGTLKGVKGWVEYNIDIPADGWYALWLTGMTPEWDHDVFVDGKLLWYLTTNDPKRDIDPAKRGWFKDGNLYLTQGRHAIRFRRLNHPGGLPSAWELRSTNGDPAGSVCVMESGDHSVRAGDKITLKVKGGGTETALSYALMALDEGTNKSTPIGEVDFSATQAPEEKTVEVALPSQGVFEIVASVNNQLLRPADFKAGEFVVIDTTHPPTPGTELSTKNIVDIDCTAPPPAKGEGYWEKDGATTVKETPFGRYRESSGHGSDSQWGTDGFSYRFDIPEANRMYRLLVDYPDDDRRSMGFWIDDGAKIQANFMGVTNGGGVETGDHYTLTKKMLTYQAFFYPRKDKGLVVAIINLVPGMKAAAARIRIDLIDSPLPAAPLGETRDRMMGFYFEEPGRWLRFFGGNTKEISEDIKTMERWGQWNRYIGANLMFPTINVYQGNHYPSRILEGYFNTPLDETRLAALMAEKYNNQFIPEFHLSGQNWFDRHVMGVWANKKGQGTDVTFDVHFASKEAEDCVIRDRDGNYAFGAKPFGYNALNPKVQQLYIDVFGELADKLADCKSFAGISSRMMLSWQYQGWNTVEGLNWGYDDWTIAHFTQETGIAVPGVPDSPDRFRRRFDFLTGPMLNKWLTWRCEKIFDFHKRLLARIQQAKPTAKLYFSYTRPDPKSSYSADMRDQLLDAGVDLKLYEKEPDIVFLPTAMYGRRFSTPIGDAEAMATLTDPGVQAVSGSGGRGISFYSNYYEVNKHLDWTKLGGAPYAAFDACIPSDLNEREFYAIALANSDCSFISTGGNGWIFGNPQIMQPFLREFRALPAKPFERFQQVSDPVAVWKYRDEDGTFWFYAVNRLRSPVSVTVSFKGENPSVYPAPGGEKLSLQDAKLTIPLDPFMMRSFRVRDGELADCTVQTPQDYIDSLKSQIESAQVFLEDLKTRRIVPAMTQQDTAQMVSQLGDALAAFNSGKYWLAHSQLESLPLTRMEYASGRYLTGVLQRSTPLGVPNFSDDAPAELQATPMVSPGNLASVASLTYDESGNLWAASGDDATEFDTAGKWKATLSLFAPYAFDRREKYDRGDLREATLYPTLPYDSRIILGMPDQQFIAQQGMEAPVIYDMKSGRAERLQLGNKVEAAAPCSLLAVNATGNSLISSRIGINEYSTEGTWLKKISDETAQAGAVDQSGTIYLAEATGITSIPPQGDSTEIIAEPAVQALVVSTDGSNLYLLKKGGALDCYQQKNGKADRAWTTNLSASASTICLSPGGDLTVGFAPPDGNTVVRSYSITSSGLKSNLDLVHGYADLVAQPLSQPTQLKIYDGHIYFESQGKLMSLTPGEAGKPDQIQTAYEPAFPSGKPEITSFGFTPDGDLYLATSGGGMKPGPDLYLCKKNGTDWAAPEDIPEAASVLTDSTKAVTDLAVNSSGQLILRAGNNQSIDRNDDSLFLWKPGSTPQLLVDLGGSEVSPGEYGLQEMPNGELLVAGGNTHGVWHLSADGTVLWKIQRVKSCPPGYADLRCPLGIAADSKGNVWVSDPTRHQILQFDAQGNLVKAMGSFGNGSDPKRLSLNQPEGMATLKDASGREWLYVADIGNGRIVRWPINP